MHLSLLCCYACEGAREWQITSCLPAFSLHVLLLIYVGTIVLVHAVTCWMVFFQGLNGFCFMHKGDVICHS